MTRRFVISAVELSSDDEKQFIEFLREKHVAWWHWINNFWLVVDRRDNINVNDLRDHLKNYSGFRRGLILQVDKITWAGFRNDPKMFEWVRSTWDKD